MIIDRIIFILLLCDNELYYNDNITWCNKTIIVNSEITLNI